MNTTSKFPAIFALRGNWSDHAKKLKTKFPKLTDTDLEFIKGKENDLLNRIEVRLDKKRDEVVSILNQIQK
jgi:uncharacterized protein YjbJ (UPF0337 family)